MNNLTKTIGAIGCAGALFLAGCSDTYRGVYEGYAVQVEKNSNNSNIITVYSNGKDAGCLIATDEVGNDGRVERIVLIGVPVGNDVEKFANVGEIRKIFEDVTREKYEKTLGEKDE